MFDQASRTWPPCNALLNEDKTRDLLCFTSLLWCDSVHRALHWAPTETQSFLTLSPLSHYPCPTKAATQQLSSHCSDRENSLWSFRGCEAYHWSSGHANSKRAHSEWALMDVVPLEEDMPDLPVPDNRLCLPGGALRGCAVVFVMVCSVTISPLQGPCYISPRLALSVVPCLSR